MITPGQDIHWERLSFDELSRDALYALLALRQEVFVVEQKCAYLDADGRDKRSHHLLGWDEREELAAALRIVPPGFRFPQPSIGRVVTRQDLRGRGLGKALMREGIAWSRSLYPGQPVKISAQQYLERFYRELGFATAGEGNPYDEDGIPHVEMILPSEE